MVFLILFAIFAVVIPITLLVIRKQKSTTSIEHLTKSTEQAKTDVRNYINANRNNDGS
ncbi:hypothetical protein SAMN05421663_10810 [Terribacillus halophilus]|uniref:Uncharacterized protein n=1 Tax=Terribacillus halophilus TaxID=361279 RepID=A0A1G6T1Y8_9BACI|nr:hypothetical protein SAMN05421663_10810 [Terribacillus halophilus]